MKLTHNMLAELRLCCHGGVLEGEPASLSALLDFAEEMLPLREALLALLEVRAKETALRISERGAIFRGSPEAKIMREHDLAREAFWALAHKLADTDAKEKS